MDGMKSGMKEEDQIGKSFPWERGAGDVTGVSEKAERGGGPSLSLSSCSSLLKA